MSDRDRYRCSACGQLGANVRTCPNHPVNPKRENQQRPSPCPIDQRARESARARSDAFAHSAERIQLGRRPNTWLELPDGRRKELLEEAREHLNSSRAGDAASSAPFESEPETPPLDETESVRTVIELCRVDRTEVRRRGSAQLDRVEAKLDRLLELFEREMMR